MPEADNRSRFNEMLRSPGMRYAYQISYSIRLLGDICARYQNAQDADDSTCALSMLDAFYVHVRLLAEFLKRPTKNTDFGPQTFGVAWTCPVSPAAQRLDDYWLRASKYVVHFGHARVPDEVADLVVFDVSAQGLRDMAADVFEVADALVATLEAGAPGGAVLTVRDLQASHLRLELDRAVASLPANSETT